MTLFDFKNIPISRTGKQGSKIYRSDQKNTGHGPAYSPAYATSQPRSRSRPRITISTAHLFVELPPSVIDGLQLALYDGRGHA